MSRTYKRRAPRHAFARGFEPLDRAPEPPHVEEQVRNDSSPEKRHAAPAAPAASEAPRPRQRLVETYAEFDEHNMPRRGETYEEWRFRLADEESSGLLLI
jgi:hypothetical protein